MNVKNISVTGPKPASPGPANASTQIAETLHFFETSGYIRRLAGLPLHFQHGAISLYARGFLQSGTPADHAALENALHVQLIREEAKAAEQKLAEFRAENECPGPARKQQRRRIRRNGQLEALRAEVREMHKAGLSQREMIVRLAGKPRPPRVAWRDLDWPKAYNRHHGAVSKWLSHAGKQG